VESGIKDFKLTSWGQLDEDSALGKDTKKDIAGWVQTYGGKVVVSESFPVGTLDFVPVLTKMKAAAPQVVYSTTSADAPTILKQANEIGFKTQWIFSNQMKPTLLAQQAGKLVEGVWQAVTFDPTWDRPSVKEFVAAMTAFKGPQALTSSEALGYDGPTRLFMAIEKANSLDKAKWVEALYQVDWDGPYMLGKYDSTGNARNAVTLMSIKLDGTYAAIKKLI